MLATDLSIALDPARIMETAGLTPDPWQRQVLNSAASNILLLCSRQAGKSTVTAALATWTALYQPGSLTLCLSPTLRQSQELFKRVSAFWQAVPGAVPAKEESSLRIELVNKSRIIALPGNNDANIRGYSNVAVCIVDESARVSNELYHAIRPMVAVSRGRIICLSTPFGRRGFYFEAWENGGDLWQRFKITAHQCPRISPEYLESERIALGPWFYEQEYECQFKDSVDSVFSYESIMNAITDEYTPLLAD